MTCLSRSHSLLLHHLCNVSINDYIMSPFMGLLTHSPFLCVGCAPVWVMGPWQDRTTPATLNPTGGHLSPGTCHHRVPATSHIVPRQGLLVTVMSPFPAVSSEGSWREPFKTFQTTSCSSSLKTSRLFPFLSEPQAKSLQWPQGWSLCHCRATTLGHGPAMLVPLRGPSVLLL